MYQTVRHTAPERRLGSVIAWGYIAFIARRVATLATWASLVIGSWGLSTGLYPAFLGLRLIVSWLWVTTLLRPPYTEYEPPAPSRSG